MKNDVKHHPGESSFTIIETLIALGIMLTVVLEVAGAQGNISAFANYSRRVTEATWLAKRIMSQVEYHWHQKDFKDLDTNQSDQSFDFGTRAPSDFDYTYNISIEEWKLPLFDILTGGGPQTDDEDDRYYDRQQQPMGGGLDSFGGLDQIIDSVFDGHIMKIAHVEVFWPEGARRNSVTLSYLLTNQRALDAFLVGRGQAVQNMLSAVQADVSGREQDENPPRDRSEDDDEDFDDMGEN